MQVYFRLALLFILETDFAGRMLGIFKKLAFLAVVYSVSRVIIFHVLCVELEVYVAMYCAFCSMYGLVSCQVFLKACNRPNAYNVRSL